MCDHSVTAPSLLHPEPPFLVYHHWADLNTGILYTDRIGSYVSLALAQKAAQICLGYYVDLYAQAGFFGCAYRQIDLLYRGLITFYRDGDELPVSEFEIRKVKAWDAMTKPVGDEDEAALVDRAKQHKPAPVVKIPPQDRTIVESADRPSAAATEGGRCIDRIGPEADPHWAQTRIPYFRRRDEGPFRGIDDPPYSDSFRVWSPAAEPIVTLQREECDKEATRIQENGKEGADKGKAKANAKARDNGKATGKGYFRCGHGRRKATRKGKATDTGKGADK